MYGPELRSAPAIKARRRGRHNPCASPQHCFVVQAAEALPAASCCCCCCQVDVSRHMGQSLNVVHLVEVRQQQQQWPC
jgi:hypothetical protein